MNICEIKLLARQSHSAGQRQAQVAMSGNGSTARDMQKRFDKMVQELSKTAIPQDLWTIAAKVSDVPNVDEALRGFLEDPTGDNATCLVRDVITAYLKG